MASLRFRRAGVGYATRARRVVPRQAWFTVTMNVVCTIPLLALLLMFGPACAPNGSKTNPQSSRVADTTTASGGATTPVATAPASDEFFSVDFISPDIGWVAGSRGILATRDGGQHWDAQYETPSGVRDLNFLDAQTGFAIEPLPDTAGGSRSGGVDILLATTDGGTHWQAAPNWTPVRFTHIDFVSATAGWAIGHAQANDDPGTLFQTSDAGRSWRGVASPAESACFGDDSVGWLAAGDEVRRTADGGATWSASFTNPFAGEGDKAWLATLHCAGRDTAWASFADGVAAGSEAYAIFRTIDGGSHWEFVIEGSLGGAMRTHKGPGQAPGPIDVPDDADAYVVGVCSACHGSGTSSIEVSHDAGTTWGDPVEIVGAGPFATALDFVDMAHGWLATDDGLFATTDGGQTWARQLPSLIPIPRPTASAIPAVSPDVAYTLSYRVILTCAAQSPRGSDVEFSLRYQRVPVEHDAGADIVFVYGMGATLERIDAVTGIQPVDESAQGAGAERLSLAGDSGTLQFVVRPNMDVAGAIRAGLYVPGTHVEVPAGSVSECSTQLFIPD